MFYRRRGQDGRYNAKRQHDTNTTPHGLQTQPTPAEQQDSPCTPSAINSEGRVHRASRPRHDRRPGLHEMDTNTKMAQADAPPTQNYTTHLAVRGLGAGYDGAL